MTETQATVKCTQCEATFTKPTQLLAEQALRMHVGRTHTQNIKQAGEQNSGASRRFQQPLPGYAPLGQEGGTKRSYTKPRYYLNPDQKRSVVSFISARRNEFASKRTCFEAALDAVGLKGKIRSHSATTARYFKKAEGESPIRNTRSQAQPVKQPVKHDVHVNFCPNCGCNLHAVAMGMALATNT